MADTTATSVRLRAPVITLARTAAPTSSTLDTTDPTLIALHAQAENALSMALSLLHSSQSTAADLQRATGRVIRAATLMKRLSAAQVEGGAA